jgi:hypothetical protein
MEIGESSNSMEVAASAIVSDLMLGIIDAPPAPVVKDLSTTRDATKSGISS